MSRFDTPGDAVGIVASQSICEPITQMALSSFHHAGTSAKKIVEGVPRMEEIMNISFKEERSSCEIYLKRDVDAVNIIHTTVKDLINYYYIEENMDSWWYTIAEDVMLYKKPSKNREKILLRMVFNTSEMYSRKISLKKIGDKIKETISYDKLEILISPEHIGIIDIANSEGCKRKNIKLELFQILKEIVLPISFTQLKFYDVSIKDRIAHTIGTDLKNTLCLDFVDYTKTTSNSGIDVYKTLGVEAARKCLVIELSKTLHGNITFHDKHINLIADFITHRGGMIPINSAGVSQYSTNCLANASYERTIKGFVNAASFGHEDSLDNASESIIVGSRVRNLGTGVMDILDNE
jgi:DNA-directed RNA polymerase subunit A"